MNPATLGHPCVGHRRQSLPCGGRSPRAGCSEGIASRLVCRVLAPPEAPGRRPRSASYVDVSQPQPSADFWSSTTSFASQLLSHFRVPAFAAASPDAVLREASTKEREIQKAKAPLDVSAFLAPVGVWELKHIRKLSSLTALTYYMHLVTPRRLQRMHGMDLVTTFRACEIRPYEHNRTAEEVGADGDGMAVSVLEVREVYQSLKRDGAAAAAAAAAAAGPSGLGLGALGLPSSSNIVTLPRELPYHVVSPPAAVDTQPPASAAPGGPSWPVPPSLLGGPAAPAAAAGAAQQGQQQGQQQQQSGSGPTAALPRMLRSPAEVVAAKLAEAAAAASTAAAASPLASAAESLYAGLAALPIRSGLVGTSNQRSGTTALPAPPAGPAVVTGAADGAVPAAATDVAAAPAADGGAGYPGLGGRKATAATIAAMAADQIRQQTIRGAIFGSGLGGGMAAVSASGMLSPASTTTTTTTTTTSTSSTSSATSSSSASLTFSSGSSMHCPSEWFVVDDPATTTRVFVIQGSDTLDHWKLNLTFDPVTFEEPSLGVKVHRGVYEAANVLYDRFLPLVYEHLESSPFSKIAFTGHSIGGSLATLLMLMYRCRGVLPPHSIATVYTFGAPAVFCQSQAHAGHSGSSGSGTSGSGGVSSVPCPPSASTSWVSPSLWSLGSINSGSSMGSASSVGSYEDAPLASSPTPSHAPGSAPGCACGADLLLARLHLPPAIVRNVIMTRDIVPRAFACDYSPVADILKGWGPSFKDHCCLNRHGRKHLYYFVGRMCILQPDSSHTFTASDPDHPMLPPGPDLLALVDSPIGAASASGSSASPHPAGPPARPAARNITEAVWELMDCPHPLETLADPGAYLASGSISRYHNPEHYTKALGRITFLKRQAEKRHAPPPPPPTTTTMMTTQAAGEGCDEGGCGVAVEAAEVQDAVAAVAVPWDSSDGLDLDLRRVAPAHLVTDAHACR